MNKKILIVGATNCGKTTLANYINKKEKKIFPTQEVVYGEHTIDTPGAYLSSQYLKNHIIIEAQNARCILILLSTEHFLNIYPPNFAKTFNKKVIGVVTKSDLYKENIPKCHKQLEMLGIDKPYYNISMSDAYSLHNLIQALDLDWT